MKTLVIILFILFNLNGSDVISNPQKSNPETSRKQMKPKKNAQENMFLENESRFGFDETVEKVKNEFEAKAWKVSALHDLQQTLKSFGKEVLPVKVFSVCHPKHSGRILELDDERILSPMMPCRVSVYQKSNGKTYLSRINSLSMARSFNGVMGEVMTGTSLEIEEIIKQIIVHH